MLVASYSCPWHWKSHHLYCWEYNCLAHHLPYANFSGTLLKDTLLSHSIQDCLERRLDMAWLYMANNAAAIELLFTLLNIGPLILQSILFLNLLCMFQHAVYSSSQNKVKLTIIIDELY